RRTARARGVAVFRRRKEGRMATAESLSGMDGGNGWSRRSRGTSLRPPKCASSSILILGRLFWRWEERSEELLASKRLNPSRSNVGAEQERRTSRQMRLALMGIDGDGHVAGLCPGIGH